MLHRITTWPRCASVSLQNESVTVTEVFAALPQQNQLLPTSTRCYCGQVLLQLVMTQLSLVPGQLGQSHSPCFCSQPPAETALTCAVMW